MFWGLFLGEKGGQKIHPESRAELKSEFGNFVAKIHTARVWPRQIGTFPETLGKNPSPTKKTNWDGRAQIVKPSCLKQALSTVPLRKAPRQDFQQTPVLQLALAAARRCQGPIAKFSAAIEKREDFSGFHFGGIAGDVLRTLLLDTFQGKNPSRVFLTEKRTYTITSTTTKKPEGL